MHQQIWKHGRPSDSRCRYGRPGAGESGEELERHVRRLALHYRQVFARHLSGLFRLFPSDVLDHLPPHFRSHHRRSHSTQSEWLRNHIPLVLHVKSTYYVHPPPATLRKKKTDFKTLT